MPYKKKQRKISGGTLTGALAIFFETGFDFFNLGLTFDAWPQHKDYFMGLWLQFKPFTVDTIPINPEPGTRPAGWWHEHRYHRKVTRGRPCKDMEQEYRCGMPRFWDSPVCICETEAEFLEREGLLTEHEKALMQEQPA